MSPWEMVKGMFYITRDFWYMAVVIGLVYLISFFVFGG